MQAFLTEVEDIHLNQLSSNDLVTNGFPDLWTNFLTLFVRQPWITDAIRRQVRLKDKLYNMVIQYSLNPWINPVVNSLNQLDIAKQYWCILDVNDNYTKIVTGLQFLVANPPEQVPTQLIDAILTAKLTNIVTPLRLLDYAKTTLQPETLRIPNDIYSLIVGSLIPGTYPSVQEFDTISYMNVLVGVINDTFPITTLDYINKLENRYKGIVNTCIQGLTAYHDKSLQPLIDTLNTVIDRVPSRYNEITSIVMKNNLQGEYDMLQIEHSRANIWEQ